MTTATKNAASKNGTAKRTKSTEQLVSSRRTPSPRSSRSIRRLLQLGASVIRHQQRLRASAEAGSRSLRCDHGKPEVARAIRPLCLSQGRRPSQRIARRSVDQVCGHVRVPRRSEQGRLQADETDQRPLFAFFEGREDITRVEVSSSVNGWNRFNIDVKDPNGSDDDCEIEMKMTRGNH